MKKSISMQTTLPQVGSGTLRLASRTAVSTGMSLMRGDGDGGYAAGKSPNKRAWRTDALDVRVACRGLHRKYFGVSTRQALGYALSKTTWRQRAPSIQCYY